MAHDGEAVNRLMSEAKKEMMKSKSVPMRSSKSLDEWDEPNFNEGLLKRATVNQARGGSGELR